MKVEILNTPEQLGEAAAVYCANLLNQVIQEKGKARIILSTGASQFEFFNSFVKQDIDWSRIEMFHLDEYINMPESHPASFRKYLKERFLNHVNLKKTYFVNGQGDISQDIQHLTEEIRKEPIDLALIGIGENAHIAFNDPPADFDTREAYIVVNLDENCRKQQVREGWFSTINDVPTEAISMSVYQILQSKVIVSCVPHRVKANAIKLTLESEVTNLIPATKLKTHDHVILFLDQESAVLINKQQE